MHRLFTFLAAVLLGLMLVSCSPSPGVSVGGSNPDEFASIETIARGAYITSEDVIPIALTYEEAEVYPDRLEVILKGRDGTQIAQQTIEGEQLLDEVLPDLTLPPLDSDMYFLNFSLYQGDSLIYEKETEFFFVSGSYTIEGISSYPPVFSPSSTALLTLNLDVPEGSDPYIVWRIGDTVLQAGNLSMRADKLEWQCPDTTGIYSIQAELFPIPPGSDQTFPFHSTESMNVEAFVTDVSGSSKNELSPLESYYSLFHFRGNTLDSAPSGEGREAARIGKPDLDVRGNLFGYHLDGSSGFSVPENLIPSGEDGGVTPFSVKSRFQLDEADRESNLFTVTNEGGGVIFRLFIKADGEAGLGVGTPESSGIVASNEYRFSAGKVYDLTVSVIPEGDQTNVFWFVDGLPVVEQRTSDNLVFGEQPLVSIIGGEKGFAGVIDEFGVFYRDAKGRNAPCPDVFFSGMSDELGDDLLFADGFDGIYPGDDIIGTGDVSVSDGYLHLGEDSAVELLPVEMTFQKIIFEVETPSLQSDGAVEVTMLNQEGLVPLMTLDFSANLSLPDGAEVPPDISVSLKNIELEHNENGIFLCLDTGKIRLLEGSFPAAQIQFSFSSKEIPLLIDHVLIKRETNRIVEENSDNQKVKTPLVDVS